MSKLRSKCCGATVTRQRTVIFGEVRENFYKCDECHFYLTPTEVEEETPKEIKP